MSRPQRRHIGRGGDTAHDEYNNCKSAATSDTDLSRNFIDTIDLQYVWGRLPFFLSAKSVILTIVEEASHILLLSNKYYDKALENFYFQYFVKKMIFV